MKSKTTIQQMIKPFIITSIFFRKAFQYSAFAIILFLCSLSNLSAQNTQIIKGRIIDDASKTPLPGVTILILDSAKNIATTTDMEGDYKLNNIPLGRQTIKISFIGYEPVTIPNLVVTAGKEVILNVNLTESINNLNEITVVYDRTKDKTVTNNEMTTVSSRSFNIDDTKKYGNQGW